MQEHDAVGRRRRHRPCPENGRPVQPKPQSQSPYNPVLDANPTSTHPSPDPRSTTRSDLPTPTLSIRRSTTIPGAGRQGARQTDGTSRASRPSSPPHAPARNNQSPRGPHRPKHPSEDSPRGSTTPTLHHEPRLPGIHHASRENAIASTLTPHRPRDPAPQARATRRPGAPTTGPKPTPSPFGPLLPVNARCPAKMGAVTGTPATAGTRHR